jgi:hypothetical protein
MMWRRVHSLKELNGRQAGRAGSPECLTTKSFLAIKVVIWRCPGREGIHKKEVRSFHDCRQPSFRGVMGVRVAEEH